LRFHVLTAACMLFCALLWFELPFKFIDQNNFTRQYNPEDSSEQHVLAHLTV
jgi:hypothetical protein